MDMFRNNDFMNQQKKDDDEELVVYKINKEDFVVPKKYSKNFSNLIFSRNPRCFR